MIVISTLSKQSVLTLIEAETDIPGNAIDRKSIFFDLVYCAQMVMVTYIIAMSEEISEFS